MPLISTAARYFDEVARVGSFRSAAERLNVSPSAVNRQILNLEVEYGAALFERLPRGIRLTAAGEILLERVRRWRREHEQARRHLQELRGLRRGHVTIGLMECLASEFIPAVFSRIQAKHHGITLDGVVGGTEQIARDITAGAIDIAIAFNMPERREIKTVWSTGAPIGLVAAHGHPLAASSPAKLSDCAGYPLILPDWTLSIRPVIEAALTDAGLDTLSIVTSNSIALIKATVRGGRGVAFLTRIDVSGELQARELVFRPIDDRRMKPETLSLCVYGARSSSPAVALVAETVQSALTDMTAFLSSIEFSGSVPKATRKRRR
jgi:DNA-binding transcriptional LysR family regulator